MTSATSKCSSPIPTSARWGRRAAATFLVLGAVLSSAASAMAAAPTVRHLDPYLTTNVAWLGAEINPDGNATTYQVQYGATAGYGSTLPASGAGASVELGSDFVPVGLKVTGLQPATTYHYRVVATNADGTTPGPDQSFTTVAPQQRGDGVGLDGARKIELVSTPDKNFIRPNVGAITDDGNRVVYSMTGGYEQTTSGTTNYLRAERTASGWKTAGAVNPPRSQFPEVSNWAIQRTNRELTEYAFTGAVQAATGGELRPSVRTDRNGNVTKVYRYGERGLKPLVTEDLEHAFEADNGAGDGHLFDYGTSPPTQLDLLPDGTPASCGIPSNPYGFAGGGGEASTDQNWVSEDGSRVFFITPGNDCTAPRRLFVRDGGVTTAISKPPTGETERDAYFVRSTPDGSKVLYTTAARVVTTGPKADTNDNTDVYRYTLSGGNECVTCMVADASVTAQGSRNSDAVASRDGLRIYFVSNNQLIPGEGRSGVPNLYVVDGEALKHVATIDQPLPFRLSYFSAGFEAQVDITPDGSALAFDSTARLTAYDNQGVTQWYRYDLDREAVTRITDGSGGVQVPKIGEMQRRSLLSDDGDTYVFRTEEALVAGDTNGQQDVYEWRDGQVGLVTDGVTRLVPGTTTEKTFVAGITPDARSVLIVSNQKLTPEVQEAGPPSPQLYVARVGGGFPSLPPPAPACEGDACQGGPAQAPGLSSPGAWFGAGDGTPPPRAAVSAGRLSRSQRARLVRGGRVVLPVRVNRSGRVTVRGRARIAGRLRTVSSASASARRAGVVRVGVRLSLAGRRQLDRRGRLSVSLSVSFTGLREPRTLKLDLRRAK